MKTIKSIAIILCAAALMACNNNDAADVNGGDVVAGEPCEVNLLISSVATRGITDQTVDGTNLESAVKVLEFYVFDSNGNPDVEVGRVNETTPGKGYVKVTTTTNEKIHKIVMAGGDNKKIAAVINMNLGELTTNTYAGLKAELAKWAYTATGSNHNARVEDRTNGFEMTGEKVFSIAAGSINNTVTVNVERLSSRINAPILKTTDAGFINLDADDFEEIWADKADQLNGKTISYKDGGFVVINGRAKSDAFFIGNAEGDYRKTKTMVVDSKTYIVPDWDIWSGTGKDVLRSAFDGSGFYTNTYSGKGAAADWFLSGVEADGEHRVYVFENKPALKTVGLITGYDPASTYALILKGTFEIAEDATLNRTRYWRVDLTRDDDYHVYRNNSYKITVNKVSTPGYGTPEEAENENPIIPGKDQTSADVKIVVSPWTLNNYSTEM